MEREAKKAARAERLRRRDPNRQTPEEAAATRKSRATRLKLFNLTINDDDKVREFQNHSCAVSGERYRKDGVPLLLNLDHDHTSGRVMGYLKGQINKGIEFFDRDPVKLRKAADFLEDPPVPKALGEAVYGVMGRTTGKAKNRKWGPDGTKTPQPRKRTS